jgi:hypothetical protein
VSTANKTDDVKHHRGLADVQRLGDVAVAAAPGQLPKDLQLPLQFPFAERGQRALTGCAGRGELPGHVERRANSGRHSAARPWMTNSAPGSRLPGGTVNAALRQPAGTLVSLLAESGVGPARRQPCQRESPWTGSVSPTGPSNAGNIAMGLNTAQGFPHTVRCRADRACQGSVRAGPSPPGRLMWRAHATVSGAAVLWSAAQEARRRNPSWDGEPGSAFHTMMCCSGSVPQVSVFQSSVSSPTTG